MSTLFFDKFPKIKYDINNSINNNRFDNVTNIFIRIAYLKEILGNLSAYYVYEVEDGETPEILAQIVYEDVGAAWMIIYANQIMDPQFEWPLDYISFQKYIIDKYGSVENAKTGIHHYEKVVTRTVDTGPDQIVTVNRFNINGKILTDGVLTLANTNGTFTVGEDVFYGDVYTTYANATFKGQVSDWNSTDKILTVANTQGHLVLYNTIRGNTSLANGQIVSTSFDTAHTPYDYYDSLPETQSYETYDIEGRTIVETINRNAVSNYDYENQINENRRLIKVIKKEYYGRIMGEFDKMIGNDTVMRRVR